MPGQEAERPGLSDELQRRKYAAQQQREQGSHTNDIERRKEDIKKQEREDKGKTDRVEDRKQKGK